MANIIIPNRIKNNGPFLMDGNQLEDLGNILDEIEKNINDAIEIEIEEIIKAEYDDSNGLIPTLNKDEYKEKIRRSYKYSSHITKASLKSKDKKILEDKSLNLLLKDKHINDFSPIELEINIENGPIKLNLEIQSLYGSGFSSNLVINNDSTANDIQYKLNKWVNNNKPNKLVQIWSSWSPLLSMILIGILGLISIISIISIRTNSNKDFLNKESYELLSKGLGPNETNKALSLILQYESNYICIPDNYKNTMNNLEAKNVEANTKYIIYGLAMYILLLMIAPKTIIGIGKKKLKVLFYKKWIYIMLYSIPVLIVSSLYNIMIGHFKF